MERACQECQTCCVVAGITEGRVDSPAGSPCAHQCSSGCGIHDDVTRPKICGSFMCAWLRGTGSPDDRPDKIGAMFSVNVTPRGHIGIVIETIEGALRTTAKEMALDFVRTLNLPLVVSLYGSKPPRDFGDQLVLKREHVLKAFAMRGSWIADLADDVKLYHLARAS